MASKKKLIEIYKGFEIFENTITQSGYKTQHINVNNSFMALNTLSAARRVIDTYKKRQK